MKQHVIDWVIRNKFLFWKIENSKGKLVADNSPNKEHSSKDENGARLGIELDALERLNLTERYSVLAMQKNGQDWQMHPFQTYAPTNNNTGGNFPLDLAMMLGRMQAEQASQQQIWHLQREKEERERREQESGGFGDIAGMLKPLAPAIISSVAPLAIKGVFDLAGKSPQILTLLERITANPAVQAGIEQAVTAYFTKQTQAPEYGTTGTDIEEFND